ncbi:MAG: hybrid sensor histidine kinase/response regulator [Pseudomonadota bacterium]
MTAHDLRTGALASYELNEKLKTTEEAATSAHSQSWDKTTETRLNQIKIINDNFVQLFAGTIVGSGVLVLVLWNSVDQWTLLTWMAAVWVIAVLRSLVFRRHKQAEPDRSQVNAIAKEMVLFAGVAGLAWGMGGLIFYVPGDFLTAVILTLILGGMISGCVATYAGHPPVYFAFSVPVVLPFAIEGLLFGQGNDWVPAFGLLFLLAVDTSYCKSIHKIIVESLELRFENEGLVRSLREQKQEVELASLQRSRFLAASSHDLRQPLHALGLLHASLEDRYGQAVPAVFARIREARAAMVEMFNGFMDMSRIETRAVSIEPSIFDLNRTVADLVAEYAGHGEAPRVVYSGPSHPVVVSMDRALLSRIIRNLVSNALKFSGDATVDVALRADAETVQLSVSDTGIGIAEEDLPKIFGEYTQLQSDAERARGVGLGLAIVREFAAMLNINISVSSALGQGTTFDLRLPTDSIAAAVAEGEPVLESAISALQGKLIAVLDDDPSVQDALSALMLTWGAEVVGATRFEHLVSRLDRAPDVLISDYDLGRDAPNGIEAHASLVEEYNTDIPLLLISGNARLSALASGAVTASKAKFLAKPVEASDLRATLFPMISGGGSAADAGS